MSAAAVRSLNALADEVIACERCPRLREYCRHVGEIKRKLPGASTLDLRVEDRITVVE